MKKQANNSILRLLQILDLNELQYNKYMFDLAYSYLDKLTDSNRVMCHNLTQKKAFWQWWKMQYANIDAQFFSEYSNNNSLKAASSATLLNYYVNKHINMIARPDTIIYTLEKQYINATNYNIIN